MPPIRLLPLRKRLRAEVDELLDTLIGQVTGGERPLELSTDVRKYVLQQPWYGNTRELENFIKRLLVFCETANPTLTEVENILSMDSINKSDEKSEQFYGVTESEICDQFTQYFFDRRILYNQWQEIIHRLRCNFIQKYLDSTAGNKQEAGKRLGLKKYTIYEILRNLRIR
jgi:DNA-binding NtrC family response regulator